MNNNYNKSFKLIIISLILLLTKEILSSPSKNIPMPDMKPIKNRYADLLNSLVKVNQERVDTLKKLFTLYDVNGAKLFMRTFQDTKSNQRRPLTFQPDEYTEIINKPEERDVCFCQRTDTESNSDEEFYEQFKDTSREETFLRARSNNDKSSTDTDHISFLSIYRQPRSYSIKKTQRKQLIRDKATPIKSKHHSPNKCKDYITPERGFKYCKTACRDAYERACTKHDCSERFIKHLRKYCRHECDKQFTQPDDSDTWIDWETFRKKK